MDKKNVLILYSCLQEGVFLQQNVSLVCQFVEQLKTNRIIILTSFDTLKLAIQNDNVEIVVDKISDKSIMQIIKRDKIDLFIPIVGDVDDIVKKICYKLKKLKVANLCEDYFTHKTFLDFKYCKDINIAINNDNDFAEVIKNTANDNEKKILNVIAIKDKFGNQVIFDILEYEEKTRTYITWNCEARNKRYIQQKIDKIGRFLNITNCLYNIKIIINDNTLIVDEIDYRFNKILLFFIQARQINISKIMLDIFNEKLVINHLSLKNYYKFNGKNDSFSFNFLKTNICNNKEYFLIGNIKKNHIMQYALKHDINNNFKLQYVKHNNIVKNDEKYILVSIGDDFINDVNVQILFYKLCNLLAKKTGYNLLLLVKKNIILSSLVKNVDIIFYNNIAANSFKTILRK